jgi:hypothetical protein
METNKPRPSAGFGPLKDLHNLQQNGSASLAELKEFLGRLQGRSPQEVVGLVSTSMMVQSMVIATVSTVALLAIFTIGPYMVYGAPKVKEKAKPPVAAAAPADAPKETAKSGDPNAVDPAKAAKVLGVDETKTAKPDENPLDKKFDNLLDGAK